MAEGERGDRHPDFESGNEEATKHGANSDRRVTPRAQKHYEQLRQAIEQELAWSPLLEIPVRRAARQEAIAELLTEWLDAHGVVGEDGDVLAAVRELIRSDRRALEYAKELALTIRSRVQLQLDHERVELAQVREYVVTVFRVAGLYIVPARREEFLEAADRALGELPRVAGEAEPPEIVVEPDR